MNIYKWVNDLPQDCLESEGNYFTVECCRKAYALQLNRDIGITLTFKENGFLQLFAKCAINETHKQIADTFLQHQTHDFALYVGHESVARLAPPDCFCSSTSIRIIGAYGSSQVTFINSLSHYKDPEHIYTNFNNMHTEPFGRLLKKHVDEHNQFLSSTFQALGIYSSMAGLLHEITDFHHHVSEAACRHMHKGAYQVRAMAKATPAKEYKRHICGSRIKELLNELRSKIEAEVFTG